MYNLPLLQKYCNGKSIALVGGSPRLLGGSLGKYIDSYDLVVRLNFGFPQGKQQDLGTRTDILGIGGWHNHKLRVKLTKSVVTRYYDPFFVVSLNNKKQFLSHGIELGKLNDIERWCRHLTRGGRCIVIEYSGELWTQLSQAIDAYPTSGCIMIDLLTRYIEYPEMRLFGFDFLKQPSWYSTEIAPIHNGMRELQHVRKLQEDYPLFLQE